MTTERARGRLLVVLGLTVLAVVIQPTAVTDAQTAPPDAEAAAEPGAGNWASISAGGDHTCGIRTSGRLFCWGQDTFGQLGDGGTNTDQPSPVQVGTGANWSRVSAGASHTCAIKTNARLFCWGLDSTEQLGDGGGVTNQPRPVREASNATNWLAVDAGGGHTCALTNTGRLFCWGSDTRGRLGDGAVILQQAEPVEVAGAATNWATIDAGDSHTCATKLNGRLYCWGFDGFSKLGDGDTETDQPTPVQVAGNATNWASVAVGDFHTCAVKTNGRLFCWGSDDQGQRGDGPANTGVDGDPIRIGTATDWTAVSAGRVHACARNAGRHLFCWGNDATGQVGNDTGTSDQPAPVEVDGAATDWAGISVGRLHTCARRTTNTLYCWGFDDSGQLGDGGTDTNQAVPSQV